MTDLHVAEAEPTTPWPHWMEKWVLPFLSDTALWPVVVAGIGHIVALLALVLLTAWRKPLPIGAFGAGLLFLLTAKIAWTEIRFYKRPGPMTAFLALCWALSIGSAIFADHHGLL